MVVVEIIDAVAPDAAPAIPREQPVELAGRVGRFGLERAAIDQHRQPAVGHAVARLQQQGLRVGRAHSAAASLGVWTIRTGGFSVATANGSRLSSELLTCSARLIATFCACSSAAKSLCPAGSVSSVRSISSISENSPSCASSAAATRVEEGDSPARVCTAAVRKRSASAFQMSSMVLMPSRRWSAVKRSNIGASSARPNVECTPEVARPLRPDGIAAKTSLMPPLPIDAVLPALKAALERGPYAVLVAAPGAGKTTRVPLALLDAPWLTQRLAERPVSGSLGPERIIMLEPRRLAARAAARFMAASLGEPVGYRVRLDSRIGPRTRIEVVTEGVFTRMLLDDPELKGVAAVLFDEFHERSLDADLGLALTLDAAALRPDLRILV